MAALMPYLLVGFGGFIGANARAGVPHADPDDIAQNYWNLHTHATNPSMSSPPD